MNTAKHFQHTLKFTAALAIVFGFLLISNPTYADSYQVQTTAEPTVTSPADSSSTSGSPSSTNIDPAAQSTQSIESTDKNTSDTTATQQSSAPSGIPQTNESSASSDSQSTDSSTENISTSDQPVATPSPADTTTEQTTEDQNAVGNVSDTNSETAATTTPATETNKNDINVSDIGNSTDPAIKQSSDNPFINFFTGITSGIAGSIIYPLVASRQGAQFISHFRTLLSPNRWDVSQNWADLDQKYNPDYVKTYYTDAQDWYDNRVQKETWEVPFADKTGTARATYIKNGDSKKTIIYGQGWTTEPEGMGRISKMFYDLGYNVLMPYTRGQNASDGEWLTFGNKDKQDWVNWINQIDQVNGKDSQIVLYGQSLGADTALQYAGSGNLPSSVKATIEDCGFSTLPSLIYHLYNGAANSLNSITSKIGWNLNGSIPLVPFDQLLTAMNNINKFVQGFNLDDVSGITAVKNSKLPTLFISTQDDAFIPDSETQTMYNMSASSDKKLWILDGHVGGHASASNAVQDYMKNIEAFLAQVTSQSSNDRLDVPAANTVAA
ncbi:alpha/beta hydrolase [Lentilactobacillus parabuchneri]